MFLTSDALRQDVHAHHVITPPDDIPVADHPGYIEKLFQGAYYELSLGDEIFISTKESPTILRDRAVANIEPGEFVIVSTAETISMPPDRLAFISMKFGFTENGLINVSGFHIDPGFKGKIHFAVYHAGPATVTVRRLEPMFLLFLTKIDEVKKPDLYDDKHKHQSLSLIPAETIMRLKGPPISLKHLDSRLGKLESTVTVLLTLMGALLVAAIGAILRFR